jgi:hypothetical protein
MEIEEGWKTSCGEGVEACEEGRYKASWKNELEIPWRKAGPPKSSR